MDETSKTLFAGDTLRSDGKTIEAAGAGFTLDPVREQESILMLAALDFDLLLAGHGKPYHPGAVVKVREFVGTLPVQH